MADGGGNGEHDGSTVAHNDNMAGKKHNPLPFFLTSFSPYIHPHHANLIIFIAR